jgi:hypothetical protein
MDAFLMFLSNPITTLVLGIFGSFIFWWIMVHITPKVKFEEYISKRRASNGETPSGVKYLIQFWNAGWRDIIDVEISARLVIKGVRRSYPRNWSSFSVPLGYEKMPQMYRWSIKKKFAEWSIIKNFRKSRIRRKLRKMSISVIRQYRESSIAKQLKKRPLLKWLEEERTMRKKSPLKRLTRLDVHKIEELQEAGYASFIIGKLREKQEISQELEDFGLLDAQHLRENPNLLEHLLKLRRSAFLEISIFGYDKFSGTRKLFVTTYELKDIKKADFYGKEHKLDEIKLVNAARRHRVLQQPAIATIAAADNK